MWVRVYGHCLKRGYPQHRTKRAAVITALFLAAQRGQGEIVKLLVTNGASPVQPCFIQGSTELCTPAEVASLNLHFKLSRWLKSAAKARRKEDEVLAMDDEDRLSQVSSRLARGMERARSNYNMSGQLARVSRGSRAGGAISVDGGLTAPSGVGGPPSLALTAQGFAPPQSVDAEQDPQRLAALNFMQNVDLAAFDPEASELGRPGSAPLHRANKAAGGSVRKLLKRLISWGGRDGGGAGGALNPGSPTHAASPSGVRASASHRVRAPGPARNLAVDLEAVDPARPDHTKVLQRFLKDLDLAHWRPEHDGPLERSTAGPGTTGSTRPASPSRSRASPPRSVRGNASPARSRA
ncbi:hypothetical protein GPECTOR_4g707 [Gonium pectorale]|uniref:Uncharacterized protein n=1 Tax=Gonium pectorale TaxID=33097 RepID=A0A150GXT6_GONPE|nr:hypothetical protein GPECTOR_4g707 [Gonium pectorale]|eukprot:KXZ54641.1 hypothetical protein GPECTOR_4g707 [Gonium pectorale]